MNDEINKNNMIPGSCDEFTKAEDIAALSKYLKKVKSDLEARTTLEKDNLEVFGRKDPRYNKPLNNLPDGIEVLNQKDTERQQWTEAQKAVEQRRLTIESNASSVSGFAGTIGNIPGVSFKNNMNYAASAMNYVGPVYYEDEAF